MVQAFERYQANETAKVDQLTQVIFEELTTRIKGSCLDFYARCLSLPNILSKDELYLYNRYQDIIRVKLNIKLFNDPTSPNLQFDEKVEQFSVVDMTIDWSEYLNKLSIRVREDIKGSVIPSQ